MQEKVKVAVFAAFATAATAAGLAVSAPANAAYYSTNEVWANGCRSGYVCLTDDYQHQYSGVGFNADAWNLGTIPTSYRWINNAASSAANNSSGGNVTKFYNTAGGLGTARCLRAGYWSDYMTGLNNAASAVVWASSCGSATPLSDQY
ncbi:hypothetical protein ACWKSP_41230 [Micromonosporaceae bacterium Da 78-11]